MAQVHPVSCCFCRRMHSCIRSKDSQRRNLCGDEMMDGWMGWDEKMVIYHLVMTSSSPWKITMLLIGKPSISMGINGPFSMAMLNNQRVMGFHGIWNPLFNIVNQASTGDWSAPSFQPPGVPGSRISSRSAVGDKASEKLGLQKTEIWIIGPNLIPPILTWLILNLIIY